MSRTSIALSILGLMAVVAPLQAQRAGGQGVSISGHVTDLSTGNPIENALVEFPALQRQTLTDQSGRFALANVRLGKHKVVITQLGYKTLVREVIIADNEPLIMPLEPDPVMIKGLDIQVDRLETRRRAVGVSAQAFSRKELVGTSHVSAADFVRRRTPMVPCPSGRGTCLRHRGQIIAPIVYIDERRAFGLEELEAYPMYDVYLVESYENGRHIRIYTTWFMQNLARNSVRLQQVILW
ncbi:MAG: carboxypeptidase-like regulatory domain-containing protein [Gemmatimonadota bacterium]